MKEYGEKCIIAVGSMTFALKGQKLFGQNNIVSSVTHLAPVYDKTRMRLRNCIGLPIYKGCCRSSLWKRDSLFRGYQNGR